MILLDLIDKDIQYITRVVFDPFVYIEACNKLCFSLTINYLCAVIQVLWYTIIWLLDFLYKLPYPITQVTIKKYHFWEGFTQHLSAKVLTFGIIWRTLLKADVINSYLELYDINQGVRNHFLSILWSDDFGQIYHNTHRLYLNWRRPNQGFYDWFDVST